MDRQQINESAKSAVAEERKSRGDLMPGSSQSNRVHPKYDLEGQIQDMQPGSSRAQVMGRDMLDKRNNLLDRN